MNSEAFYLILNYLAALSLILLALTIRLHSVREPFHKNLSILLTLLGISYWLVSFAQERDSRIYTQLANTGFTSFFILSLYSTIVFRNFRFSDLAQKDIVALRLVFYSMVASIFLFVSHYLTKSGVFSFNLGNYSGVWAIISVHVISKLYFSQNEFTVKKEVGQIGNFLIFSLVTSGLLFLSGVAIISGQQLFLVIAIIFLSALVFSAMALQIAAGQNTELAKGLNILADMNRSSLPIFLKELNQSILFKNIYVLRPNEIEELECRDVYTLLKNGIIVNGEMIEQGLQQKNKAGTEVGALLALQSILKYKKGHAITRLGNSQFILVAEQIPLSSQLVFNALLKHVSQVIETLVAVPNGYPENVIPFRDQISYQDS